MINLNFLTIINRVTLKKKKIMTLSLNYTIVDVNVLNNGLYIIILLLHDKYSVLFFRVFQY